MTFQQVERHDIDQFRLLFESHYHIGAKPAGASRSRGTLADIALGVDELGAIGQEPQTIID
jgi:hypothetical protein